MVVINDPIRRALQQLAEPQFSDLQRLVPHIDTQVREKIEGIQPDVVIPLFTMQGIDGGRFEVGNLRS